MGLYLFQAIMFALRNLGKSYIQLSVCTSNEHDTSLQQLYISLENRSIFDSIFKVADTAWRSLPLSYLISLFHADEPSNLCLREGGRKQLLLCIWFHLVFFCLITELNW